MKTSMESTRPGGTGILEWVRTSRGAGAAAGVMALVVALGCNNPIKDVQAKPQEYTGGDTPREIPADIRVYDDANDAGSCGATAEKFSAVPAQEHANAKGDVQMYGYDAGDVPLKDGHDCAGTVWIHFNPEPEWFK